MLISVIGSGESPKETVCIWYQKTLRIGLKCHSQWIYVGKPLFGIGDAFQYPANISVLIVLLPPSDESRPSPGRRCAYIRLSEGRSTTSNFC